MLITMMQIPASYLIPSARYLLVCMQIASLPGLLHHQFLILLTVFCILVTPPPPPKKKKTGGIEGLGTRLCVPPAASIRIHTGNKKRLDLFWLHCVSLVCCRSPGVLFLPILVRCCTFGRNGTSVTLQKF